MGGKCECRRLSPIAFGVSLGIITGLSMMLFALSSWLWGYGAPMIEQWGSVFPGVGASLKGSFIGLAWGFLEGYILGLLWAWVYNICLCCCRSCPCCERTDKGCVAK